MPEVPGRLITYCTNIHPGESWRETFAALRAHVPAIRHVVAPDRPFPLGLRLSAQAATELTPDENRCFTAWLAEQDCFIPTLNGFPFGSFHGSAVKERVYLPDWRSPERVAYTRRLAQLLAGWLPAGITGSISTVPIGFKSRVTAGDFAQVRENLLAVLEELARIRQEKGQEIVLALEPEPCCVLETSEEVIAFFERLSVPADRRDLLGICYDCCHQAVEFEDPVHSLNQLADAGVRIVKVQVSSALRLVDPVGERLTPFAESCYLHQVVIRRPDGTLIRYPDLPEALSRHRGSAGEEWRCHFHVPLFWEGGDGVATTRPFLAAALPRIPADTLREIETYTWEVLPPELRTATVTESIIREFRWLEERLSCSAPSS